MDDRSKPNSDFIIDARGVLLRRREELADRVLRTERDLHREHEPLVADFADQAIQRGNEDVLREIGAAARSQLSQVNHALERLDAGQYLICARCGTAIDEARLSAVPETEVCAGCATRQPNQG